QSMLSSATLSSAFMELAYVFMNDAVRVSVTPEQVTAENVEHLVYHVSKHEKVPLLLGTLRTAGDGARVLIFVNMRRSAERLVRYLEANGFAAAAITGDVDQRRRPPILGDIQESRPPTLRATARRLARPPHRGRDPRHQLRFAARPRRLRPSRRADGAGRGVGTRGQPRVRGVRRGAGSDRALHRLQAAIRDRRRAHARSPGASSAA